MWCHNVVQWSGPVLQVGLKVLQKNRQVFACHKTIADTIWHSELGASLAIIKVPRVLASPTHE